MGELRYEIRPGYSGAEAMSMAIPTVIPYEDVKEARLDLILPRIEYGDHRLPHTEQAITANLAGRAIYQSNRQSYACPYACLQVDQEDVVFLISYSAVVLENAVDELQAHTFERSQQTYIDP
jgi:hypothetical protein